jgi:hypothetical protein
MSLILRWFNDNGERHRVYYRSDERTGRPELVIACRDWEHAEPAPSRQPLEDLPEERLRHLARSWRRRAAD